MRPPPYPIYPILIGGNGAAIKSGDLHDPRAICGLQGERRAREVRPADSGRLDGISPAESLAWWPANPGERTIVAPRNNCSAQRRIIFVEKIYSLSLVPVLPKTRVRPHQTRQVASIDAPSGPRTRWPAPPTLPRLYESRFVDRLVILSRLSPLARIALWPPMTNWELRDFTFHAYASIFALYWRTLPSANVGT